MEILGTSFKAFAAASFLTAAPVEETSVVTSQEEPFHATFFLTSDLHSALTPEKDATFYQEAMNPHFLSLREQIGTKNLTKDATVGGVARRIEYLDAVRKLKSGSTLVLDAGDFLEGTLWYHTFKGTLDVEMMNEVGYDAMAIGNHDFAGGWDKLKELLKQAKFPVLCSNIFEIDPLTEKPKPESILEPYHIFTMEGGRKVAVIGIMGEDSWYGIRPSDRAGLHFEAPENTLKPLLEELRPSVDYIVALSHSGIRTDRALAEKFPEIDAFLGGHSHTIMERAEQVGNTPVFHPYARGRMVAKFEVNGKETTSSVEILDETWDPKLSETAKKVDELLKSKQSEIEGAFKEVIAECTEPVSAVGKVDGNTDFGRLLCEMVRTAGTEADIGFVLSGSFKGNGLLETGPITLKNIHELLPHDGDVWTVQANGAWIEKMMLDNEQRWGKARQFQYSGIEFTPNGLEINGQPLEKERWYTVRSAAFFFEREIMGKDLKILPTLLTNDPTVPSVKSDIAIHPDQATALFIKAFQERKEITPLSSASCIQG